MSVWISDLFLENGERHRKIGKSQPYLSSCCKVDKLPEVQKLE